LCYKLQYVDRLKRKEKWYFSFGTTMHECAEQFFKVKAPPCPSLEELLQIYEQKWIPDGYESPEEAVRYKEYGKDILKKFWEIHAPGFRLPVAAEFQFYLDVAGFKVMGYIDRVDKLESGGLEITDYKTNQELFTADYVDNNLQLTIYQMAAEQAWRLPVEKLSLYHLRTNTPCYTMPRGKTQIEEAKRLVIDTAEKIQRGEFPATENQYCPCDFPQYCPYYRHQYSLNTPQKESQAMLPGMAAAAAAERYASLQEQIKELEAQLNEVKQVIIKYCQEQELNRVFGSGHQVTYKLVEKSGYNAEDVRTILEPAGLWSRVLSLDQALLKQLLADKAVPADVKQKIEAVKRITSAYPQLWVKALSEEDEE